VTERRRLGESGFSAARDNGTPSSNLGSMKKKLSLLF